MDNVPAKYRLMIHTSQPLSLNWSQVFEFDQRGEKSRHQNWLNESTTQGQNKTKNSKVYEKMRVKREIKIFHCWVRLFLKTVRETAFILYGPVHLRTRHHRQHQYYILRFTFLWAGINEHTAMPLYHFILWTPERIIEMKTKVEWSGIERWAIKVF